MASSRCVPSRDQFGAKPVSSYHWTETFTFPLLVIPPLVFLSVRNLSVPIAFAIGTSWVLSWLGVTWEIKKITAQQNKLIEILQSLQLVQNWKGTDFWEMPVGQSCFLKQVWVAAAGLPLTVRGAAVVLMFLNFFLLVRKVPYYLCPVLKNFPCGKLKTLLVTTVLI